MHLYELQGNCYNEHREGWEFKNLNFDDMNLKVRIIKDFKMCDTVRKNFKLLQIDLNTGYCTWKRCIDVETFELDEISNYQCFDHILILETVSQRNRSDLSLFGFFIFLFFCVCIKAHICCASVAFQSNYNKDTIAAP